MRQTKVIEILIVSAVLIAVALVLGCKDEVEEIEEIFEKAPLIPPNILIISCPCGWTHEIQGKELIYRSRYTKVVEPNTITIHACNYVTDEPEPDKGDDFDIVIEKQDPNDFILSELVVVVEELQKMVDILIDAGSVHNNCLESLRDINTNLLERIIRIERAAQSESAASWVEAVERWPDAQGYVTDNFGRTTPVPTFTEDSNEPPIIIETIGDFIDIEVNPAVYGAIKIISECPECGYDFHKEPEPTEPTIELIEARIVYGDPDSELEIYESEPDEPKAEMTMWTCNNPDCDRVFRKMGSLLSHNCVIMGQNEPLGNWYDRGTHVFTVDKPEPNEPEKISISSMLTELIDDKLSDLQEPNEIHNVFNSERFKLVTDDQDWQWTKCSECGKKLHITEGHFCITAFIRNIPTWPEYIELEKRLVISYKIPDTYITEYNNVTKSFDIVQAHKSESWPKGTKIYFKE